MSIKGPVEVSQSVLELLAYTSGGIIVRDPETNVSRLKVAGVLYTTGPEREVSDR